MAKSQNQTLSISSSSASGVCSKPGNQECIVWNLKSLEFCSVKTAIL
jgi:hypothetical protein